MKKQIKVTLIVIVAAIIAAAIIWYVMYLRGKEQDLLTPVGTRAEFIGDTDKYPTMLTAKGTRILNAGGEQVVLKGVMVPESRSLYEEKKFNEDFYKDVFAKGGNAIRVPISPEEYKNDDYYMWRYLDRIVTWAGENDNYVILDWDYTGNPIDGSGDEMPDLDENPLDYSALARSPAELCVVAANAQNGEAQYFTKADLHPDDYRILMASCCIPVIDQPCVIGGIPYFDGGLAYPVPLEWAFAHGCDRVALILTKPIGLVSSDARDKHLAHLLQSHYPAAAEGLRRRAWRYNTAVQRARELERQGLVCIIAPDSTEGMSTLTKNRACLEKMYAKGKQDAEALVRWMQNTKQDESVGA